MPSLAESTSPLSLAKDHLRRQLAACASGQEFLHAAGDDQALARIYSDALPPPGDKVEHTLDEIRRLRPFVVVGTSGADGFRYDYSALGTFRESGILMVQLERDVEKGCERDYAANLRRFENEIGNWLKEAVALREVAGYLAITQAAVVQIYQNPPEHESALGSFLFALVRIAWQG